MFWKMVHPQARIEMLGCIPDFLSESDPRSAREQFDANYISGWHPLPRFTMLPNGNMSYPGDPPTRLLAETELRAETIRFYEHSWVTVIQPDGSYEVSRMD
jgi:hypothetical protein